MNMVSCLLLVCPNFQTLTGFNWREALWKKRQEKQIWKREKIDPNKPAKEKEGNKDMWCSRNVQMYQFFCDDNAVISVSHRPWKIKLFKSAVYCCTTVALKIKAVFLLLTSTQETRGLLDRGPVWSWWQTEKLELFCQALFLSVHAFLADESLRERKIKACAKIQWFFSGRSPAERKRETEARVDSNERK